MKLYDLKTAGTRPFSKDIRIDRVKRQRLTKHLGLPTLYDELECSLDSTSFRKRSLYKTVKTPKSENGPKGGQNTVKAHLRFYRNQAQSLQRFIFSYAGKDKCQVSEDKYQVSEDKCQVSEDKCQDRREMEYFHEAINSIGDRKGKR